jgi:hypothetical protein
MQNQDEHFASQTSVVILYGGNVERTAYTEIIVACCGIAAHVAITIVFTPITNNCQEEGN